jgi:hypothetical protein
MKYKTPYDFRVGKRNDHFCSTRLSVPHGRNTKRVINVLELERRKRAGLIQDG